MHDSHRRALNWLHYTSDASLFSSLFFCWRRILLEHFRNFLLNQSDIFVGIVGQCVIRYTPPDGFFQLRIRELYYESALFYEWIFEIALNRIYELVSTAKSDNEVGICVHPHLLQSL